jgi:hypothetical protein
MPPVMPHLGQAAKTRIWTLLDEISLDLQCLRLFARRLWTFLECGVGAAKRIRTPDPRITNSEILGVSHTRVATVKAPGADS